MFGTIRRHQAWLWWIIAAVTIGSFVVLGPSGLNDLKLSALGGGSGYGKIGDHDITLDELRNTQREVTLRYFLTTQQWPTANSDFNLGHETYIRLFLIQKEKEFGIKVGADRLAEYARRILGTARLTDFEDQILKPAGLNDDDFQRFLTHEIGVQQLLSVAGLSGKLVTPAEAETMYREEHEQLSCSMILLSASNYLSGVVVSNTALEQFYTNRMSVYREPARMQVNYVKFNVTNYWAETVKSLTNLDAEVDTEVKKAGTNLVGHAKTPAESRAAIRDALIRRAALKPARRDSGKFAEELDAMQPKKPGNIETLAKQKGLTVATTEPFDELEGPKDMNVLYSFSKTAFQLTEAEPFSGSIMAEDGVYVLGFNKLIPSFVPPLKAVQDKVTEDFRYYQAMLTVQRIGVTTHAELTNGLAQGKSFSVMAAKMALKTESLPPFSLSTTNLPPSLEAKVSLNALRQAAFSTEVGGVSPMTRAEHGVFLLYVEKKLPVDEANMKTELPQFLAYMRQGRQVDAFNQWFSTQIRQDPAFAAILQQASQEGQPRSGARRTK